MFVQVEMIICIGYVLFDSYSWNIVVQGFVNEVVEKIEGCVRIDVFLGGQFGNEKDMIEGLQFGVI